MTQEMYESLAMTDLRAIAKQRGLKVAARAKKAELIGQMMKLDMEEARAAAAGSSEAAAPVSQEQEKPVPEKAAPAAETAERPAERAAGTPARQGRGIQRRTSERRAPRAAAQERSRTAPAQEPSKDTYDAVAEQEAREERQEKAPAAQSRYGGSQEIDNRYQRRGLVRPDQPVLHKDELNKELDSGEMANGILEVMPDGYGFIRSANYLPGDNDVYVAPSQIRRFNLKTGDIIKGHIRIRTQGEKFSALLFVDSVNGRNPEDAKRRFNFEDMTPIFPNEKIRLETYNSTIAMRVMDLFCPVGKGQRGMIVSPPKAGKTTLVKEVAKSVKFNNPEIHLIILLIDERPEEVTDIKEAIAGPNVEVIYSTFDETPEHHKRVSEMVIERAKRLVEHKQDVMILLDSITRLTRAYNLTEPSSGRTLSGGLDPAALHMPKRFFGAARNMREGGSLTILATALIETGSKMDDVVYEEFKGTGNMEMILNRKLSERRIFPAIDLAKSGTRRDDLLLTQEEQESVSILRSALIGARGEDATDQVLDLFSKTRSNNEFVAMVRKIQWSF